LLRKPDGYPNANRKRTERIFKTETENGTGSARPEGRANLETGRQDRLGGANRQRFGPARHGDIEISGIQGVSVENYSGFSLKAFQKQGAADGSPWQRPPDEPILLTHPDCSLMEGELVQSMA